MDEETATPFEAPVESPSIETGSDPLADFLKEDEPTQAKPEDSGDAEQAPEAEGEAQKADGEDKEAPPEEQPIYKVKVRGEEIDVPLNELLNGYSRTEDYKAKTAEVAEQRRQLATEYADKLEQQVQLFTQLDPILSQTQNLDWNALAQQDPTLYVQLKAQHDARVSLIQSAIGEISQARQADTAKQQEAYQQHIASEREALVKAAPELADASKFDGFAKGIVEYLKSNGFSDEVINTTDDHRALLIADKARKWDELQKAKTTAETKKAPPARQTTLRPQAAQSPRAPSKPSPTADDESRRAWILAQLDAE